MNWKLRAELLRAFDALPGGNAVYQFLQSRFGYFHRRPGFIAGRLSRQKELASRVIDHGGRLEGAHVVEVGTGWVPLAPLGFWICGAARVTTFDLNPFLIPSLVTHCCRWIADHRDEAAAIWRGLCTEGDVLEKIEIISQLKDRPEELLKVAGIDYRAPADAATSDLPDASIDIHYSGNVFEHIPPESLCRILGEARRILRPGGLAVHFVDPSDHFAHNDPSISRINFLQLDEAQWRRYYDNRYSYLNRCHDSDYREMFERASLKLLSCGFDVDERARALLQQGFPLAPAFRHKSVDDLCRQSLIYVAAARDSRAPGSPPAPIASSDELGAHKLEKEP